MRYGSVCSGFNPLPANMPGDTNEDRLRQFAEMVSIHSRLICREIRLSRTPMIIVTIFQEKRERWRHDRPWKVNRNRTKTKWKTFHRVTACANPPVKTPSLKVRALHTMSVSSKSTALNLPNSIRFFDKGSTIR